MTINVTDEHPAAQRATLPEMYSRTLPRSESSAATARDMVRYALAAWHLTEATRLVEEAELVASELVTNAVRHARGTSIRVTLTLLGPDGVRVAVVDRSRACPRRCAPDASEAHGRGLLLVNALSHRWGWERMCWQDRVWGKRVWSDLCRHADDAR